MGPIAVELSPCTLDDTWDGVVAGPVPGLANAWVPASPASSASVHWAPGDGLETAAAAALASAAAILARFFFPQRFPLLATRQGWWAPPCVGQASMHLSVECTAGGAVSTAAARDSGQPATPATPSARKSLGRAQPMESTAKPSAQQQGADVCIRAGGADRAQAQGQDRWCRGCCRWPRRRRRGARPARGGGPRLGRA